MKLLSIILLTICMSGSEINYIKALEINDKKLIIYYDSSKKDSYKIHGTQNNRFFLRDNNEKIYIDVEQKARWVRSLDSSLKANTIRPSNVCSYLPIIYLVFIVDENGNIIEKGMSRQFATDDYQMEFHRLMKLIDYKLIPARRNGKNVASLLEVQIDYYKLIE